VRSKRFHAAALAAAALALWAAGPALAEAPLGWFSAGINATDYVFNLGGQGTDRRRGRLNPNETDVRRYRDPAVLFPPPEGLNALSIRARPNARPGGMGTLSRSISAARFRGKRVRLSAGMRTQDAGRAQLWMRVNGANDQVLSIDDMQSRPLRGTTRWRRYAIVLDVPQNAADITYGFLLAGSGAVWANDFSVTPVSNTTPLTSGARGRAPSQP
jgi:hypothetical protein